ncbi:MAG: molecular chaperone [Aeromonadaceae bacterium]
MRIGFDYGTSNCAVALWQAGQVRRLPLEGSELYLPSTLHAPHRDAIADLLLPLVAPAQRASFIEQRGVALAKASRLRAAIEDDGLEYQLLVGRAATECYLAEPDEGYYLKSPKSFLGATGLTEGQIQLFRDIVAAMMATIKQRAESELQAEIQQAVIGQPVNFQGLGGEESNRQARHILSQAATLAGFTDVEFQYEPVAAGLEFEATLHQEQVVLVLDIGGGTTDCSMLRMGPERVLSSSRQADLLGHSGQRLGGNDFDIRLAVAELMPLCGMNSVNRRGLPMPSKLFWDAMSINDVQAQGRFYAPDTVRLLRQLILDGANANLLNRLGWVREHKQTHHLVWEAEQAKIQMSSDDEFARFVTLLDESLSVPFSQQRFAEVSQPLLEKIGELADEAVQQAGVTPQVIFVTGGTARSPVIRAWLQQRFAGSQIVEGDHFGSVIAGLARWAERCFA